MPYYREKGPGVQGKGRQNADTAFLALRLGVALYLLISGASGFATVSCLDSRGTTSASSRQVQLLGLGGVAGRAKGLRGILPASLRRATGLRMLLANDQAGLPKGPSPIPLKLAFRPVP